MSDSQTHANEVLPAHVLNQLKDQLLIVLVNRLGGEVELPVNEVDGTGQYMMDLEADHNNGSFKLKVNKKN